MSAIASISDVLARLAVPRRRRHQLAYAGDQPCPGCGGRHWLLGRSTAECAFCATALPLASSPLNGACSVISQGDF